MPLLQSAADDFWITLREMVTGAISTFRVQDAFDILIMAFLIYHLIGLLRETRAGQLLKGVFGILLLYFFAYVLELYTLRTVMEMVVRYGALVLLVLFQPELRKVLEQVGRTSISNLSVFAPNMSAGEYERKQMIKTINAICDSCAILSKEQIGALIVLERETRIGDIISTGTIIDSQPSADLIKNVFFPNSPLHDGALVIRSRRLYAAGCFLPLSDNYDISKALGTRHRAALGMSEVSDALIVVVSEETGNITVAQNGKLDIGITVSTLSAILYREFVTEEKESTTEKKKLFRRSRK
ncbi:MAG: TIGR00159 family protein [Angelakisella sp.]|jgi:diadenylate cyclase|nr:TIGR00159 family protein [Angelakisella sp.]